MADYSLGGQSFSTDSLLSPVHTQNITNFEDEDVDPEEPPTQDTVDRENSFEDLEQFLSQLDWTLPHCSTNNNTLDSELSCDHSMELDESHMEELEMRALKEHLKSIVKDIHIAIGEHSVDVYYFYHLEVPVTSNMKCFQKEYNKSPYKEFYSVSHHLLFHFAHAK